MQKRPPRRRWRRILPGIDGAGLHDSRTSFCHGCYEPVADGNGAAGDAGDAVGDGGGEADGVAVAVPVTNAGMGTVCGIVGPEVSGWIGMGEVWGAFCTGVATGLGVSGAGVEPAPAGSCTGDSGAWSHPAMDAARNRRRTRFMVMPANGNIIVFPGFPSNNSRAARLIIRIDPSSV